MIKEYFGGILGNDTPDVPPNEVVDFMVANHQWIVGTPDDAVAAINRLQEISGGFGGLMVLVADWTTRDKVLHSYELLARYVFPHFQGTLAGIKTTARWASERKEVMQGGRLAGLKRADELYYDGKNRN